MYMKCVGLKGQVAIILTTTMGNRFSIGIGMIFLKVVCLYLSWSKMMTCSMNSLTNNGVHIKAVDGAV